MTWDCTKVPLDFTTAAGSHRAPAMPESINPLPSRRVPGRGGMVPRHGRCGWHTAVLGFRVGRQVKLARLVRLERTTYGLETRPGKEGMC